VSGYEIRDDAGHVLQVCHDGVPLSGAVYAAAVASSGRLGIHANVVDPDAPLTILWRVSAVRS
jgi:hypothetical protein